MNTLTLNQQITVMLTAAWPVIYLLAAGVKKYVKQVPNSLTGLFAMVLGVAWVCAVFAYKVPHPDWLHVILFAGAYGLSHSGFYEVAWKNLLQPFLPTSTTKAAPGPTFTVLSEPPDTGLKVGDKDASK